MPVYVLLKCQVGKISGLDTANYTYIFLLLQSKLNQNITFIINYHEIAALQTEITETEPRPVEGMYREPEQGRPSVNA